MCAASGDHQRMRNARDTRRAYGTGCRDWVVGRFACVWGRAGDRAWGGTVDGLQHALQSEMSLLCEMRSKAVSTRVLVAPHDPCRGPRCSDRCCVPRLTARLGDDARVATVSRVLCCLTCLEQ